MIWFTFARNLLRLRDAAREVRSGSDSAVRFGRAPASPSPADLRHDNQVVALGPTDGASYDIPNSPVLELARWLAARSKGAYFNLNVRGR